MALKKLRNHTWYLTPEGVVFSLCSTLASEEEKTAIANKLLQKKEEEFPPGKPDLPILYPDTTLVDLVTQTLWFLFKKLGVCGNFLELSVTPQNGE